MEAKSTTSAVWAAETEGDGGIGDVGGGALLQRGDARCEVRDKAWRCGRRRQKETAASSTSAAGAAALVRAEVEDLSSVSATSAVRHVGSSGVTVE